MPATVASGRCSITWGSPCRASPCPSASTRTVLSVLGVEPSHADAELVEWEDWAIGPTDREHPVTRGLHVGFRAGPRCR